MMRLGRSMGMASRDPGAPTAPLVGQDADPDILGRGSGCRSWRSHSKKNVRIGILTHGGAGPVLEGGTIPGCANGFWRLVGRRPIKAPMIAVRQATQLGHLVDVLDPPSR